MATGGYWATLQRRQFGRRAVLRGGATGAVGLMAASLIGCRSGGTPDGKAVPSAAESSSAGTPKRGGHIRIEADPNSLWDPYKVSGPGVQHWSAITEQLIYVNPQTFELEPKLIEKWETIEAGRKYVFHVRKGMKYENKAPTNGRLFDAKDVVYNLKYAAGLIDPKSAGAIARSSWYAGINKVDAIDDFTVSLELSKPNAAILRAMGDGRQFVIPREVPEVMPFTDYAKVPSIGPFIVKEYREGETAQYVRNPQYWDQPRPYVDSTEIKWFGDTAAANAALLTDSLDILRVKGKANYDTIKAGKDVNVPVWPSRTAQNFFINGKKFPDPRLWKAMHLIYDYTGNANAVAGENLWVHCGPINSLLPGTFTPDQLSKMPGWNPATKQADVAEGKKLLDAMGAPNGKGLVINMESAGVASGPGWDASIRFQANMRQALPDLKLELKPSPDTATGQRALANKTYDIISHGVTDGTDTRLATLAWLTGASRNYYNYSNPKVDALIERMQGEPDKEMQASVGEMQKILFEGGFPTIVSALNKDYLGARSRLRGYEERGGPASTGAGNISGNERKYMWFDDKRK